jgi:hypothetical protein
VHIKEGVYRKEEDMSFKFVARAVLVVSLAVIAGALGASSASAVSPPRVHPPEGGPPISCQIGGGPTNGVSDNYSSLCQSYESAFYVYQPNWPGFCYQYGYNGYVYTQNYTLRFQSNYCEDGVWHFSSAWGSNEARFSREWIGSSSQEWAMVQYRR